jgi:hypothetical protein
LVKFKKFLISGEFWYGNRKNSIAIALELVVAGGF